jgi:hypothetical protein
MGSAGRGVTMRQSDRDQRTVRGLRDENDNVYEQKQKREGRPGKSPIRRAAVGTKAEVAHGDIKVVTEAGNQW